MTETLTGRTGLQAHPRQAWTLVLASLGLFMVALDNMVVTLALPALRASLHGSLADLEWTVNAYLLSFACWLLTGAALGDRFVRRRMFCAGLAVFTAASAWSALSPTVGVLITARAVQGAGAAMVMPLTLTLISEAFPAGKRGMAIGLWGGIAGLAVAGGPVIGGAVVQGPELALDLLAQRPRRPGGDRRRLGHQQRPARARRRVRCGRAGVPAERGPRLDLRLHLQGQRAHAPGPVPQPRHGRRGHHRGGVQHLPGHRQRAHRD